jgi:hypothetical protein
VAYRFRVRPDFLPHDGSDTVQAVQEIKKGGKADLKNSWGET